MTTGKVHFRALKQTGTAHFLAASWSYSTRARLAPGLTDLLYLAWKTIRSDRTVLSPAASKGSYPKAKIFRQGLLTNLLNPKVALFVLALFPQFVRPQEGAVAVQILLLVTVLNVIGFAVNGAVILSASKLSRRSITRRPSRLPQYLLRSVFAGLAVRLAFASRN